MAIIIVEPLPLEDKLTPFLQRGILHTLSIKRTEQGAIMDNKILEKRLFYRESSIGLLPTVNKCAKSFADYISHTRKEGDSGYILQDGIDALRRDVKGYELDMKKVNVALKVSKQEVKEFSQQEAQLDREQAEVKESILQLTRELERQQEVVAVRAECEVIAKSFASLPCQRILKRQIEEMQSNLERTRENALDLDHKIAKRLEIIEEMDGLLSYVRVKLPKEEAEAVNTPLAASVPEDSDEEDAREEEPPAIGLYEAAVEELEDAPSVEEGAGEDEGEDGEEEGTGSKRSSPPSVDDEVAMSTTSAGNTVASSEQ